MLISGYAERLARTKFIRSEYVYGTTDKKPKKWDVCNKTSQAILEHILCVSKVPASTAAVFTGIIPISAVFLSVIVLNEPVSLRHIIGVLCVFLGIVFIKTIQPIACSVG